MNATLRMLMLGDLCLSGEVEDILTRPGSDLFSAVCGLVATNDLIVANLECGLTRSSTNKPLKFACLRANPVLAEKLRFLTVAVVGNNHFCDYGDAGARESVEVLRSAGVDCVGYGDNLAEAMRPVVVERNGIRAGILSFSCLTTNGDNYATPVSAGVAPLSLPLLKKAIRELRPRVDAMFCCVHWGKEQNHHPVIDQMRVARRAIEWGADAVVGSHAHVIQPYEKYRNGHVFHGLGNLLFGDVSWVVTGPDGRTQTGSQSQSAANRESLGVLFLIETGPAGTQVKVERVVPLRFDADYVPRPVFWKQLSFDWNRINQKTAQRAKWLRAALAKDDDIEYITRIVSGRLGHFYSTPALDEMGKSDWLRQLGETTRIFVSLRRL